MNGFQIPRAYYFVGLLTGGATLQCLVSTQYEKFQRQAVFNPPMMETITMNLPSEYKYLGGYEGYPDDGNGVYSKHLSYGDWVQLNVMQRIKRNNVEQLCFFAPFSLINGIFFPYTTCLLLSGYIGGRTMYKAGYMTDEADMNQIRQVGSLTVNVCSITTMLLILFSGLRFYGYGLRFTRFIK
ncbi:unnamed protein product [Moneuplotes crassus]|uniref:Uncharacterized protein n=1 Tax=Euplotes crassus TaxID=5936 RepID=A0AAD1XY83_EUPCR|nr:unnamed protein product [Moneuplotes crassus]